MAKTIHSKSQIGDRDSQAMKTTNRFTILDSHKGRDGRIWEVKVAFESKVGEEKEAQKCKLGIIPLI